MSSDGALSHMRFLCIIQAEISDRELEPLLWTWREREGMENVIGESSDGNLNHRKRCASLGSVWGD